MSDKINVARRATSAVLPPSSADYEAVSDKSWPMPKKFQSNTSRLPETAKTRKNSLFSDFVDTVRELLVRERRVGFQKPK